MANFKTWTICHLSVFMTFIISGLLINCVQACLYISIGWWQPTLFRKLNYYLVWMIYAQVLVIGNDHQRLFDVQKLRNRNFEIFLSKKFVKLKGDLHCLARM